MRRGGWNDEVRRGGWSEEVYREGGVLRVE